MQLHLFCDASEIAYRAVAYFCTVMCEPVKISFVISKTRLAPIKTLTIPCLELQAVVVASRLKTKMLEEIDFERISGVTPRSCCTTLATPRGDSTRTYHIELLKSPPNQTLVSGHIPGTMNVADDCTRGKEIHKLTPENGGSAVPNFSCYLRRNGRVPRRPPSE